MYGGTTYSGRIGVSMNPAQLIKLIAERAEEHDWFYWKTDRFRCCRKCGVIERKDGKNKPCKGKCKIVLRDERLTKQEGE